MNFNFNQVQNSQSTVRKQLEGNAIHEVVFDGCEVKDFAGVQDPTKQFHNLDIKFSNDNGVFVHTLWEPKDSDYQDRQTAFGPSPSNYLTMMYLIKHLIDTANPELAAQINSGEKQLNFTSWDQLRKFVVEATAPFVGKSTKIKLLKNNKGEAIFPYFANYDRNGRFYMSTNFIGDNIFWTSKELNKMQAAAEAKPTATDAFDTPVQETPTANIDFNF